MFCPDLDLLRDTSPILNGFKICQSFQQGILRRATFSKTTESDDGTLSATTASSETQLNVWSKIS